jgi:hypothetical protein
MCLLLWKTGHELSSVRQTQAQRLLESETLRQRAMNYAKEQFA